MRIAEIITADLAKAKLIQEEKLEKTVNDDRMDIEFKVENIRNILKEIVLIESMFAKWQTILRQSQPDTQALNNDLPNEG